MRTNLRMIATGLIVGSLFVSSIHLDLLLCGAAIVLFTLASIGK